MFGHITARETRDSRLAQSGKGTVAPGLGADYATEGLVCGTRVCSSEGWRDVGEIAVGDDVMTFDNGYQTVIAITDTAAAPAGVRPVYARAVSVPALALGNGEAMVLLPDQSVMVESDAAEALFGDPFAILRARDLVGLCGIGWVDEEPADVVTLHFASHEVISVGAGDGALLVADADLERHATLDVLAAPALAAPYERYSGPAARLIVSAMSETLARMGDGGPSRPAS